MTRPRRPIHEPATRAAALVAGLLLALPLPAEPQRGGAGAGPDAPRGPAAGADTVELEELVVTAHPVPLPRDALTGSVTVITREEIEASGARHVQELLRSAPGLTVAQSGSWGDPSSLFLRGGESNYVKVLVDGVPLNRPGGDLDLSTLTTANVQRIEIVRGPASVVHGSDAVTGVIQIFTRDGRGPSRLHAAARAGTFGSTDWEAGLEGGTGEVGYSFSVSRFATDGIRPFNDGHHDAVVSGRVELRPDARSRGSVSIRYSDARTGAPTNAAGAAVDSNAFRLGETLALGADVERRLTDRLGARLRLTLADTESGFDDAPDGPADTLGLFAFRSQSELTRRGAELRLDYRPGPSSVLTAGAEWEAEEERSVTRSETPFGSSVGELEADRTNLAYYLEAVASPGPVSLNAGIRVDDNEAFGSFGTYRVGAAYRLPVGPRLRVTLGNAFKEPTFTENFASGFVRGNPGLAPERSRSWEVGLEQAFADERVELSATYFDQAFRDLIQFTFSPPSPDDPNFFNVAEADARGVELRAAAEVTGGLTAELRYTWLETEVEDAGFQTGPDASFVEGEPLLRRPRHAAGATLTWRIPGGGSVRMDADYTGERIDRDFSRSPAPRIELDGYTRVDLSARLPLPWPQTPSVSPTVRIENLLDADYREIANFAARGRTLFVGTRISAGL